MKNLEPSAHKNISHCKYVHSMKLQALYKSQLCSKQRKIEQRRDSYRPLIKITRSRDVTQQQHSHN